MRTYDDTPLMIDDALLRAWLEDMLEPARVYRFWLFFLDDDNRVLRTMMPIDDYPSDPGGPCITEDLGIRTNADVFANRFAAFMEALGAAQIVLVWERRGRSRVTTRDRRWPTALGRALRAEGVLVRAQFLLHSYGIRQLAPDDLPGLIA